MKKTNKATQKKAKQAKKAKQSKTTQKKAIQRPKTVQINARPWHISYDADLIGGRFTTYNDKGIGELIVGTAWSDPIYQLRVLVHEIVEAIITDYGWRYMDTLDGGEEGKKLFVMTHAELVQFVNSLVEALRSIGLLDERVLKERTGE